MRTLPLPDPGLPEHRSPARYLRWVGRMQLRTVVGAMFFGVVWMVAQALMPAAIGRAIDAGLGRRDTGALFDWAAVLLGLGVLQAAAGMMRHRLAVSNWLTAAYRTVQVVSRHAAALGSALPRRVATGEVVSVGATDIEHIGGVAEVLGRGAGAVVSFVTVAVILLETSVPLGLVVLVGVPVLVVAIGPLLKPLHRRQRDQRALAGELTTCANDIVNGLRVLRGIGGEDVFAGRYRTRSQRLREAGCRVAGVESVLSATEILLPGVFVVVVTWLGARFALDGSISPGELVAFYGYSAFLVQPLSTGTEAADKLTRGLVAAGRVVRVLDIAPEVRDPGPGLAAEVPAGTHEVELVDEGSGLSLPGGRLTVVVATGSVDAAELADRLGRYAPGDVYFRGVRLDRIRVAELRRTILVCDTDSRLFAGVLRDELDLGGSSGGAIDAALTAASAEDIVAGLPDGLATRIEERGRSLSGGQRQRLVLARALLVDPEVLILVEPTSAVDAHTEARIAERLAAYRAGVGDRTTVVFSQSPLLAAHANTVRFVRDGRLVASGPHVDLLATVPAYRAAVLRGAGEEPSAGAARSGADRPAGVRS